MLGELVGEDTRTAFVSGPGECRDRQIVATHVVAHGHVERRRRCPLFNVAPDMEAVRARPMMQQLMDDVGISVKCGG